MARGNGRGCAGGTDTDGTSITIAEAEIATGHVDRETLDALAEVAACLPRP